MKDITYHLPFVLFTIVTAMRCLLLHEIHNNFINSQSPYQYIPILLYNTQSPCRVKTAAPATTLRNLATSNEYWFLRRVFRFVRSFPGDTRAIRSCQMELSRPIGLQRCHVISHVSRCSAFKIDNEMHYH